jgi:phosphatidylserine decarboxylase
MSMFQSVRKQIVPIHPEGYIFIADFCRRGDRFGLAVDPARLARRDPNLLVRLLFSRSAPGHAAARRADRFARRRLRELGRPSSHRRSSGSAAEPRQRVSVFMSVFDCHVNRSPVAGLIRRIAYKPGLFVNADLDKASEDNERNSLLIESPSGTYGIVQIAGLVARRIVPFVHEGDTISAGERIGLIRFGSRVDVYMPEGASVLVALGSKATAGETILAEIGTPNTPLAFRVA